MHKICPGTIAKKNKFSKPTFDSFTEIFYVYIADKYQILHSCVFIQFSVALEIVKPKN